MAHYSWAYECSHAVRYKNRRYIMVKKRFLIIVPALLSLVACQETYLTSQTSGTATIKIYKSNNSTSTERYIPPERVNLKFSYNDLSGTLSNNENVCPSIGDVNLLVIPVHTIGSTYNTDAVRSDIEKIFFGTDDEEIGYVSVKEYYYESSFGKLNFQGVVTDWFDIAEHTSIKSNGELTQGLDGTIITEVLRKAVDWAVETQGINLQDFDKNEDGSIDAVWLVYDHLNYFNQYYISEATGVIPSDDDLNTVFWNYTGWDWDTLPDLENPTTSAFSWASFDSLYSGYADYINNVPQFDDLESIKLDSHVYVHETGHLLGLEDFYSSDSYRPAGSATMMDQNIGDLDSYSKMLLGWVTPYVVYGTSEILIPSYNYNDHSVIVIPSNYEEISNQVEVSINAGTIDQFTYEFNPFSEYILIDLYTPTGLNENDAYGPFLNSRDGMPTKTGVRIYHIDSRIFKCQVVNYDGGQALNYVDDYVWDGNRLADDEAILLPISNSKTESSSFQLPESFDYFDQIRLLEASGINSFDNGTYFSSSSLWDTTSDPFDILTFGYQFFNGKYTYNDGNDLPFKISVSTLKECE